ncbi:Salt tolerance down-regulator-like protein [Elsinoe fawcettii]|nr:Salt tolerance down-regulator-like protein [Elsinoe fawcettii]
MSQQAPPQPVANGVLTARVGGNRKKQKRRAKAAARQTEPAYSQMPPSAPQVNGHVSQADYPSPNADYHAGSYPPEAYDDQYSYSSEDDEDPLAYDRHYQHDHDHAHNHSPQSKNKKKKRKSKSQAGDIQSSSYHNHMVMPPPLPTMPSQRGKNVKQDSIWNTSTQEERERIKEFWLSLSEDDRKSLLKIEKNAVLAKMKEQQKHSCSCTVCGRKRVAIEEELEVLYDAYYEELAQYANRPEDLGQTMLDSGRAPLPQAPAHTLPPRPLNTGHMPHHRTSRVTEIIDDDQPYSDEEDEEIYSDEEEIYSDEDDYDDDIPPGIGSGFFDFGQNLQVKGGSFITDMLTHLHGRLNNLPDGILTVADDLLKNDGRRFIDMMEQLAERRLQREQEVQYAAHQPKHHDEGPLDDDEEFGDEEDYDSQDEFDDEEEEDEMGGMTEEQRMEEGRRMFQIFAARMFEQRVLTAYREKVAAERQARLLEELEEEDKMKNQKDAQKAKNAEKKKSKKQAQKQAKQEEKAKKEAEEKAKKEAEEEAERQKQEELRKKRDEAKRKKDEQRRLQDEEKAKKEAERQKRLNEERERQLEADRKLREQKAAEKRSRDEAKKREREKREAEEKTARDQMALEDKLKREQELKEKSERDGKQEKKPTPQPSQILKRPSQPTQVAVPPGLISQKSTSGVSSPHIPIATPALPKAATPGVRTRRSSEQEAHTSPRGTTQPAFQTKSKSPPTIPETQQTQPRTILQNPNKQKPNVSLPQPASQQGPPPGVHPPPFQGGFGNMGFPPFGGHPIAAHQRPGPPFPQQGPSGGSFRGFPPGPVPPPGVNGFGPIAQGRGFAGDAPPGFQSQVPGLGSHAAPGMGAPRAVGSHSRQHSASAEHDMSPPHHAQPISRPAPIQRPSSVRPSAEHDGEIDDLSGHLGSRALLDDADEPLPPAAEIRRTSNPMGVPRPHMGFNSPLFTAPPNSFGAPSNNWPSPSPNAFGPPGSGLSTPSWGGPLGGASWPSSGFGHISTSHRPNIANRPRAVRIAVCNACRHLSTPGNDYHDVSVVLQQIGREGTLDAPPSLKEIEEICETEGDAHNGGGLLHVRRSGPNFAVKYEMEVTTPASGRPSGNALGEIGSPVPGNSVPAFGSGPRPFGSIGGLASPGGF